MHKQPDLFRPMCADVSARQGRLFDDDGPADSALSCGVCGRALTRTPSGFLACPRGHGYLLEEHDGDRCGRWFDDLDEEGSDSPAA
jgi:hypothetical protein